MALVGYSDSEASDSEIQNDVPTLPAKRLERTDGRKIKIDLPKPSSTENDVAEPTAKRQRTAGAFSGFNSLLPAPKRAAQSSMKPGISLRTSSEAAFSRMPAPRLSDIFDEVATTDANIEAVSEAPPEPVLVGKLTRFMPLSVANAKKKKQQAVTALSKPNDSSRVTSVLAGTEMKSTPTAPEKRSLFSFGAAEAEHIAPSSTPYEAEFVSHTTQDPTYEEPQTLDAKAAVPDNALSGVASDLSLSAADRRRLFGRSGADSNVQITHFDMNAEYQSNQDMAARGEVVEHRTVRAIAPGRHSLQQLVANVKGQTEALEDKWAEGRRNRGETGSKYGW